MNIYIRNISNIRKIRSDPSNYTRNRMYRAPFYELNELHVLVDTSTKTVHRYYSHFYVSDDTEHAYQMHRPLAPYSTVVAGISKSVSSCLRQKRRFLNLVAWILGGSPKREREANRKKKSCFPVRFGLFYMPFTFVPLILKAATPI